MGPTFVIRLDDICPTMRWASMDRAAILFRELDIRPLIGVVPDNRDPTLMLDPPRGDFWDLVRAWAADGWAVAQHGYQHLYVSPSSGMLGIASRSEFAGLPFDEQRRKLSLGREVLMARGIEADTFMAPAHSLDAVTVRALRDQGFRYVTDGFGLFPYDVDGMTFVPQLFGSPLHLGIGVYTVCLHLNEMSAARLERFERFCRQHRREIIDFHTARAIRGPRFLGPWTGWPLALGLRGARQLRARLRISAS